MDCVKKVLFLVLMLSLAYSIEISYICAHEAIHKQIFSRYGVESEVRINYFDFPFVSGLTMPTSNYKNCNNSCKLAHALNDIGGYYLSVFIMSVWALFVVYMAYRRLT